MTKIPFTVSARTARLIGRENVSNVEGAIIELVKNTYDADSTKCILIFDINYWNVPKKVELGDLGDVLKIVPEEIFHQAYSKTKENYSLNKLDPRFYAQLWNYFNSRNTLLIIDNGNGMNKKIIRENWMTIGTEYKFNSIKSSEGRVHTGAKGIGRFSLDRLGSLCEMITTNKENNKSIQWAINWDDFEKKGATITEIHANFSELSKFNYSNYLKDIFTKHNISLNSNKFVHGTCFKITNLRDFWTEEKLKELLDNLKILQPPVKTGFDLYAETPNKELSGKIESSMCDDYDYKLVAKADDKGKVRITVWRNEINVDLIDPKLFSEGYLDKKHQTLDVFRKGSFSYTTTFNKLLPGFPEEDSVLKSIGKFDFTFYFMKKSFTSKDQKKYLYREFKSSFRKAFLDQYGGIKIFRDHFRVRPYGEPSKSSFDWLGLSDRVAESPAAPSSTKSGKWRVRAHQISGNVNISRITNINFEDKSSREGLQEVNEFKAFKQLLIAIINEFEKDRQAVFIALDKLFSDKNKEEEAKEEAKSIANDVLSKPGDQDATTLTMAQAYKSLVKESEDLNEELKLLRVLASTGLVITSFSHELKNIRATIIPRVSFIRKRIQDLVDPKVIRKLSKEDNPLTM